MRRLGSVLILAALFLLAGVRQVRAQVSPRVRDQLHVVDSTKIQILTLSDGSSLVGRIVGVGADTVNFQSSAGRFPIAIGAIRDIREVPTGAIRGGNYWFPNPNATRLFFAPTGQMLKQGEGYLADYELFFPGVAYGITDHLTIGGGVSLLPAAASDQVYYLTPKIGASVSDRVHLAAGVLFAGTRGGTGGIYYSVATVGDGDGSVSLGGGYGFAGGKIQRKPVGMLGGEKRVSRRVALVTENYLLPTSDDNKLYSFGIRLMSEKLTVDLALFNTSGSGIIGIPFVDFVFRF